MTHISKTKIEGTLIMNQKRITHNVLFAKRSLFVVALCLLCSHVLAYGSSPPVNLRCEYLTDPVGIGTAEPRLNWQLAPGPRDYRQAAFHLMVASDEALLAKDTPDLLDTGKVIGRTTSQIVYSGAPLKAGQNCFWKVRIWDGTGELSGWSRPARWSVGPLQADDWQAKFISFRNASPVHQSREELYLPPARHYRKEFKASGGIKRATIHATALGIYDLYLNGRRVSDRYFAPGWSDYRKRAYYHSYDVTDLLSGGDNAIGAVVADGWYSGYVGYGVLVGYGPYKSGRCFYGKTPALMAQLEIEYEDGKSETIVTDASWKVTGDGPLREADIQAGETYDARREMPGWSKPGFDDGQWETAIPAEDNGSIVAPYFDKGGQRLVELGFVEPDKLQAYSAQPIV
ncbi:MAG TPA: alfa-L-rhamnosidase, partial [Phycisphaerales bacterium]|nr:alfa-L-rhamnosidase [Phycisphaerales bacterium]